MFEICMSSLEYIMCTKQPTFGTDLINVTLPNSNISKKLVFSKFRLNRYPPLNRSLIPVIRLRACDKGFINYYCSYKNLISQTYQSISVEAIELYI